MDIRKVKPYAVAAHLGTGELVLRVYNANTKEEALGLLFLGIQSQVKNAGTYIEDFKVLPAQEDALEGLVIEELKAGRRIGAIKEVRAYTTWGLKEAKAFVDTVLKKYPALMS